MMLAKHNGKRPTALLVVAVIAAQGVVAVTVIDTLGSNRDHADTAQRNADQARQLTRQIQRERQRFIRESCEAQNERHDNTIRTLNGLVEKATGARRRRLIQSRPGTVLLIKALSPKRDCDAVASRAVSRG